MKKWLVATLIGIVATAALAAEQKVMRFGVDPTFPPFESKNAAGQLVGFDIELGDALCAKMQAKCEWVESTFDGLIPALKARKYDAILSALAINEKRLQQIDFTERMYATTAYLVARKTAFKNSNVESVKGKRIGVIQGTVQETWVKTHWEPKGVELVPYVNSDLIYQDLVVGRLDGSVQLGVQADHGFIKTALGKDFKLVGEPLRDEKLLGMGAAIGIRKGDAATRAALNKALDEVLKDGTFKKINDKYFSFDIYKN